MPDFNLSLFLLAALCAAAMSVVLLRAIGQSALLMALDQVTTRREAEAVKRAEDAAAEALGRAAALEPLVLNPDGTIADPIIGTLENA